MLSVRKQRYCLPYHTWKNDIHDFYVAAICELRAHGAQSICWQIRHTNSINANCQCVNVLGSFLLSRIVDIFGGWRVDVGGWIASSTQVSIWMWVEGIVIFRFQQILPVPHSTNFFHFARIYPNSTPEFCVSLLLFFVCLSVCVSVFIEAWYIWRSFI